jgi:hypothetical protein
MTDCIQVSFPWAVKNVVAQFDSEPLSSDGGLLLIRSADEQLKLTERAAEIFKDVRDPSRVEHELKTLLRQRVYGICAGYEDCNDAASLKEKTEDLWSPIFLVPLAASTPSIGAAEIWRTESKI